MQSVLAKAYPRWPRIAAMQRPEAYLKTVLVNEELRWWRRLTNRELPLTGPARPEPVTVDPAGAQASRDAAWDLLRRLPGRQRAVLVLRYYEDLSDRRRPRLPPSHGALPGVPGFGDAASRDTHDGQRGFAVNEQEMETAVRELYRERERLVTGDGEGLLPAVRDRAARRRTRTWVLAASAAAVIAVLAGAALVVGWSGGAGQRPPVAASRPPVAAGWRLESSLGAQIEVPATWSTNDYGCHQTPAPSVVRGQTMSPLCYTPEPATKDLAIVGQAVDSGATPQQVGHPVTVDGVAATRADWRQPDGRYAGWVTIPARKVTITVRTTAEATTRRILDSVRLVDPDHLGCTIARPAPTGTGTPLAPANPSAVDICFYGGIDSDRLLASTWLTGTDAGSLAATIDAAAPGGNPDLPASDCTDRRTPPADAALRFHRPDGTVRVILVRFSSCTGRGVSDGSRTVHVTLGIIGQIMDPLHNLYIHYQDLPA